MNPKTKHHSKKKTEQATQNQVGLHTAALRKLPWKSMKGEGKEKKRAQK